MIIGLVAMAVSTPVFGLPGKAPANLKGCVLQSVDPNFFVGIHSIPQQPEYDFKMVAPMVVAPYGGVKVGDIYYAAQMQELYGNVLYMVEKWDASTWTSLDQQYSNSPTIMASDVAYDPTTGNVYGCYYNDTRSGWTFGIGDYENLVSDKICDLTTGWNALACTKDGQLYAIDRKGDLLKVNKQTGATTLVGSTGLDPENLSSGTIDPWSGRFFYAVSSTFESALYEINLNTAEATWLTDFQGGEEVTGMWADAPLAKADAPAPVSGLKANFAKADMSGTVSFRLPSTTYDNTPLSGNLTYRILLNGETVKTSTAAAGREVSETVKVSSRGVYEVAVVTSNAGGDSPEESVRLFIGPGMPVMPQAFLARHNENFVISWSPVVESADGGFIDTDAAVYTVTRYPDGKVVGQTDDFEFVDVVPEPEDLTTYYYSVTATIHGVTSEAVVTNNVAIGALVPPYAPDLREDLQFDAFTLYDNNLDGVKWLPDAETGCARLMHNPRLDADDWLITPALKFEEGKLYHLEFNAFGQSASYPERFEVKLGDNNTPLAMTETLVVPTVVKCKSDNPHREAVNIIATRTGRHHIGFHGISDMDMFALFIGDISVSAPMSAGTPGAVSELMIVPDIDGELQAEISLKAPEKDMVGNPLKEIVKVELYRNGELVNTWDNPAPGATLNHTDKVAKSGSYDYTAYAVNAEGKSLAADASGFIGTNVPNAVTGLRVKENYSNPGEVTLTWEAPEADIAGNPVKAESLTYTLSIYDEANDVHVPFATGITGCSHTYQAVEPGSKQKLIEWAVCAVAGENESEKSLVMGYAGAAFEAPYAESFADCALTEDMHLETTSPDDYGNLYDDGYYADIKAYDLDNGFIGLTAYKDHNISVTTGKVAVPAENPGIMYHIFNSADPTYNEDEFSVEVYDGEAWKILEYIKVKDLPRAGWNRRYLMLPDYAGRMVQARFTAITRGFSTVYLDNIKIGTLPDKDFSLAGINVPARVFADKPFSITATVENFGTEIGEAADYTLKLYADGREISSRQGKRIRSCAVTEFPFSVSLGVMDPEFTEYHVVITSEADKDRSNNESERVAVERVLPLHPMVRNLRGERSDDGIVKLSWDAPDLALGSPTEYEESFETGAPFAVDAFGDWTFVDADGGATHTVQDLNLPNQGAAMAYAVVDSSYEGLNETWAAYDGLRYLAAFDPLNKPKDDWAISPLLYGGAQTISLMAKTYNDRYGLEQFEVLYSTTGKEISDFTKIGETHDAPYDAWTEFRFDLPAGAKYFAVRCTSDDQFIFMLDDVRFYPVSTVSKPSLAGYNIYRDKVLMNETPTELAEWSDAGGTASSLYEVTAVYDLGESAPAEADFNFSGVGAVSEAVSVKVTAGKNTIRIEGCAGMPVAVYGVDGKVWLNNVACGDVSVEVPSGVYVVTTNNNKTKIIVK